QDLLAAHVGGAVEEARGHEVEAPLPHRTDVAFEELDLEALLRCGRAGAGDGGLRDVDPGRAPPAPREPDGVGALAAADVERGSGLEARRDVLEHAVDAVRPDALGLGVALLPERGRRDLGPGVR